LHSAQHCPVECMISSWQSLTFVQSIDSATPEGRVSVGLSAGKVCYRLTVWIWVLAKCATGWRRGSECWQGVLQADGVDSHMACCMQCHSACSSEIIAFQTAILIVCNHITVTVYVVQLLGLPFERTIFNAFPNLDGVTFLRRGGSEPAKLVQVSLFFPDNAARMSQSDARWLLASSPPLKHENRSGHSYLCSCFIGNKVVICWERSALFRWKSSKCVNVWEIFTCAA